MRGRTARQIRLWAIMIVAGAIAGLAYMPFIGDALSVEQGLRFAAQGALISLLLFGFEIFVAQGAASESLRRAPFAVVFCTKALISTCLIMAAYWIGGHILFPGRFADSAPLLHLARDIGYALGVALVLQFVLTVRTIVGGRVLTNLLLGRYHQPLSEERIFMFLDVVGSTALAERLGGVGAHSMISRIFFDVAQETARYGGETHEYVGDEVIVTWPLLRSGENLRCIDCYFAICDRLEAKASSYRREFGAVPEFRVGLHGGPIVAGECGDDKREIVYFGDTINTTARLQEACKRYRCSLLVSGDLMSRIDLPAHYSLVGLGAARLRGREQEVELFTLERKLFGT